MTYGAALFVIAAADTFGGFLVGMAISGLGFGTYLAVDLALVTDVLPDAADSARDLGLFNIANALPYALAPAVAPADPRGERRQLRGAVRRRGGLRPAGGRRRGADPRRALTASPRPSPRVVIRAHHVAP